MNAYKCDICGEYFEDAKALTGIDHPTYRERDGHHRVKINLDDHTKDGWNLFVGDICPDCMGYFSVELCERGCQDKKIKMYAANYIKKVQSEKQKADDEIEVGDEVRRKLAHENELGGTITKAWKDACYVLWPDGSSGRWYKHDLVKTGRHFDIDKILEGLKK